MNNIFLLPKSTILGRFSFNKNDYDDPEVKYWKSKVRYRIAHKVGNTLYVQESVDGLLKYDNGEFKISPEEKKQSSTQQYFQCSLMIIIIF